MHELTVTLCAKRAGYRLHIDNQNSHQEQFALNGTQGVWQQDKVLRGS